MLTENKELLFAFLTIFTTLLICNCLAFHFKSLKHIKTIIKKLLILANLFL